jgi:hypothetical protein
MSSDLNTRNRWQRWIKRIYNSAALLLLDDYIFNKSLEASREGGLIKPSNEVYKWVIRTYISHSTVGIRRLLDMDKRTYSLLLLLNEIENKSNIITRDFFIKSYPRRLRELAIIDFNNIAGSSENYLPQKIVRKDLIKLWSISNIIKPIVNKVIAHRERKSKSLLKISFKNIHKSITTISDMCIRYNLILNQEGTDSLLPVINASNADYDVKLVWSKKLPNP